MIFSFAFTSTGVQRPAFVSHVRKASARDIPQTVRYAPAACGQCRPLFALGGGFGARGLAKAGLTHPVLSYGSGFHFYHGGRVWGGIGRAFCLAKQREALRDVASLAASALGVSGYCALYHHAPPGPPNCADQSRKAIHLVRRHGEKGPAG